MKGTPARTVLPDRARSAAGGQERPRILFAASEVYPLVQTGGLADVAGNLPPALATLGFDVRILLPAYRGVRAAAGSVRDRGALTITATGETVHLLEAVLPGHDDVPVYLLDAPDRFDRPGNPYQDEHKREWPDNAARFGLFGRVIELLARDAAGLDWQPDLVHCNDWHTGLAPALLSLHAARPATLFTIHNLLFQGSFPFETLADLGLPASFWSPAALEFHGNVSFMKGGLVYADAITAVSRTYAREITTPEFGCGLDGLLRHRGAALIGILNGVDYTVWDPRRDPHIPRHYWRDDLEHKAEDKAALQRELGLEPHAGAALLAYVGRLTRQKGIDLILAALDALPAEVPWQLAVLGSGEAEFETALLAAAAKRPGQMAVRIGFDEALAHRIQAGADMLLMPSRFEPCGLTQLYALRYGTVPVARATGGLVDTITDADAAGLRAGTATGFLFRAAEAAALREAVQRGLALFASDPAAWRRIMLAGMGADFGWEACARHYAALYRQLLTRKTTAA